MAANDGSATTQAPTDAQARPEVDGGAMVGLPLDDEWLWDQDHWAGADQDSLGSWMRMETLAPWVLVLGLLAFLAVLLGVPSPAVTTLAGVSVVSALACGYTSLGRIRASSGALCGHGLALGGISLAWLAAVVFLAMSTAHTVLR